MNVAERRQAIIEALCVRRKETRENLAYEFGVSKRTIDYDIMALSVLYPIYTTHGPGGSIRIMDGFFLMRSSVFNQEQLDLLEKLHRSLTGREKVVMEGIIKFGGGRVNNEIV